MQTWWAYSPYYDYGFYLGGDDTRYALNSQYPTTAYPISPATWVSDVVSYGWGVVPFWVGPQAPCATSTSYSNYIKQETVSGEETQGKDQASAAESAASNLNLPADSVIYYDFEAYDPTNTACEATVAAFINGWVTKLDADGYVAGVYASSTEAEADWATIQSDKYVEPNDVWVARYDEEATIWGIGHGQSSGLADSAWAEGYRAHQYFNYGPNGNVTAAGGGESYGGVPLDCSSNCIDRDIEYAQVDGGNGAKSFTYPVAGFQTIDYPGSYATALVGIGDADMGTGGPIGDIAGQYTEDSTGTCLPNYGIWIDDLGDLSSFQANGYPTDPYGVNDLGTIVGTYPTICGGYYLSYDGFFGTPGNFTPIKYESDGTFARGINDDGVVVGYFWDANKNYYGFTYTDAGGVSVFNDPNGQQTVLLAINGFNQILLQDTGKSGKAQFFVDDDGHFTSFSPCGRTGAVWSFGQLNNNGFLVGGCTGGEGFVYNYVTKSLVSVTEPDAAPAGTFTAPSTMVYGINDAGDLVGTYLDASGVSQGFVAKPSGQ